MMLSERLPIPYYLKFRYIQRRYASAPTEASLVFRGGDKGAHHRAEVPVVFTMFSQNANPAGSRIRRK